MIVVTKDKAEKFNPGKTEKASKPAKKTDDAKKSEK